MPNRSSTLAALRPHANPPAVAALEQFLTNLRGSKNPSTCRRCANDGVGFTRPSSFGLLNMRERAALAGGALTIESSPGNGTTVVARVPVQ